MEKEKFSDRGNGGTTRDLLSAQKVYVIWKIFSFLSCFVI